MASNPVILSIPGDSSGIVNCIANAAYSQRVTLKRGDQVLGVFQGTGEGVAMKTVDGQTSLDLGPTRQPYQISAAFEFSKTGPKGRFQAASVKDPIVTTRGTFTIIEVTSEDSTDNDNNDSYLNITVALV